MTNKEKLLKEQKKLHTGEWRAGIVLPGRNKIIVSSRLNHGEILDIFGVVYVSKFYDDGGIRLVFDEDAYWGGKKAKLIVDVNMEYFDRARNIVLNCSSLYEYVSKIVFELIGPKGGMKRYSEKLLSGEEKGFSLLNPRR